MIDPSLIGWKCECEWCHMEVIIFVLILNWVAWWCAGSDAIIASFSHFLLNRSQIAQSPSFAARIENEIYAETLLLNMKKSWIHLTTRWRNPATLASSRHFNLWLLSCWWRFQLPFISYKIVILVNWSLKIKEVRVFSKPAVDVIFDGG